MNINSNKAPEPIGLYPHAKKVGNLLFLSGIGPRKKGSKDIPNNFESQCHAVFENVKNILEEAGSSWNNIIDITVFLINIKENFELYNKIYTEYFKNHPSPPTRTTVEVSRLPTKIDIELKIIAKID